MRGSGRDGSSRRAVIAGVDAYKVTGDPKSGEYDDPVFLVRLEKGPPDRRVGGARCQKRPCIVS